MNWYKRAQQQYFPFYNPAVDQPIEQRNAYERLLQEDRATAIQDLTIEEFIEDHVKSEDDLFQYFKELGLPLDKIADFPDARPIYVFTGRDKIDYVVDEFLESPDIVEAHEWVNRIDDMYLINYVEETDANKEFWEEVGPGYTLYHGTTEEDLDSIRQNGIEPRNQTRGMSNRGTGSAVFLSSEPAKAQYYYNVVVEVNVGQMKADNYMPQVGGEEPIEESEMRSALAWKIGLKDYYSEGDTSDGLDPETVIFYNAIPPKYLRVLE